MLTRWVVNRGITGQTLSIAAFALSCWIFSGCDRQTPDAKPKPAELTDKQRSDLMSEQVPKPLTGDQVPADLEDLQVAVERLGGKFEVFPVEPDRQRIKVDLGGGNVTDEDLADLAGMDRITHLVLSGSQITDAGLVHLKGATELAILEIPNTNVGDAGLEHLEGLRKLVHVSASYTKITLDGHRALAQQLEANRQRK